MNTLITNEDVDYLEKQGDISLILSGMMALLQDSDHKVEEIQRQNWFGRMWKTVTGKNKATAKEVQQNHDKLSVYMTQAMEILFERNVMTGQMVNNLGLQLNVLYQEHNHLKEMLGGFVEKLNEKIVSIDNFHMLSEEIRLKMYANDKPVIAICKIVTQLDERTVNDPRKMQILQQSLLQEGVLSETPVSLQELFMDLLTCTSEEAGQFILGLGAIRQHYLPSLFLEFLETYYYMSDMERKLKSKEKFCTHYMDAKQIESDISLTSFELYQNNMETLIESFGLLQVPTNSAIKNEENVPDDTESAEYGKECCEPHDSLDECGDSNFGNELPETSQDLDSVGKAALQLGDVAAIGMASALAVSGVSPALVGRVAIAGGVSPALVRDLCGVLLAENLQEKKKKSEMVKSEDLD